MVGVTDAVCMEKMIFENRAKDWEKVNVPVDVFEHKYTLVAARLKGKTEDEKIVLHENCQKTSDLHLDLRNQKRNTMWRIHWGKNNLYLSLI